MEKHELLIGIISLPQTFLSGNTSITSLLKDLNYEERKNEVTQDDLAEVLSEQIQCIESWQQWSADKRAEQGWYLILNGKKNIVGHHPALKGHPQINFTSRIDACAAFIKREIDSIVKT